MRVTSSVRAIIRSYDDAIADMKNVFAISMRFGTRRPDMQPVDAQPFSVSCTQDPYTPIHRACFDPSYAKEDGASLKRLNPRPLIVDRNQNIVQRILKATIDPKLILHRRKYEKAKTALASPEQISYGSRYALKRILAAIRKKDLSSLSPLLLDDSILSDIATTSKLSSLTNRQLSCLDVSDEDYLGMDGILDRWNKVDMPEDDPSGLFASLKFGKSEKLNKPILYYSVDMMAILRKKILISKMGSLPPPKEDVLRPAPKTYGLPFIRFMYASVEFAHVGTDTKGKFSDEPFLLNFHVHSY